MGPVNGDSAELRNGASAPVGATVSSDSEPGASAELTPPLVRPAPNRAGPPIDVPEFALLLRLGSGGFGEVWLARHKLLGNFRAIKLIPPSRRSELHGLRILGERIPAHPRLCPIHAVGEVGEWIYCVMPHADSAIDGLIDPSGYQPLTLTHHLARHGRLSDKETSTIGADLAEGLRHLHLHSAVHGDVKPGNVIRLEGGWRLTDYGLLSGLESNDARGLTRGYAPPEGPGTPKADQHALGVTLYVLRSGKDAASFEKERERLAELAAPARARTLGDVIRRATSPDPALRYESMADLRDDLRDVAGSLSGGAPGGAVAAGGAAPSRAGAPHWLRRAAVMFIGAISGVMFVQFGGNTALAVSGIHGVYAFWVLGFAPQLPPGSLESVAVITLQDDTDVAALAREAGIEVSPTSDRATLRRLHGELCRRLATTGARAVAFDIYFRDSSDADEALAAGIGALRDAGVGAVVALRDWDEAPGDRYPVVAKLQGAGALLGGIELFDMGAAQGLWAILAVQREEALLPSIPLAALLTCQDASAHYALSLDVDSMRIGVDWFELGEAGEPRLTRRRESASVQAAHIMDTQESIVAGGYGRRVGDKVAIIPLPPLPDQERLDAITISYQDAFRATADERRTRFADRLVIIGDLRGGRDVLKVSGRDVGGPHIHALTSAALLEQQPPRTLTWAEMQTAVAGSALIGGFWGGVSDRRRAAAHEKNHDTARRGSRRRTLLRGAGVATACLGLLAASAVLYSRTGLLIAAPSLMLVFLIALFVAAILRRRFVEPHASPEPTL